MNENIPKEVSDFFGQGNKFIVDTYVSKTINDIGIFGMLVKSYLGNDNGSKYVTKCGDMYYKYNDNVIYTGIIITSRICIHKIVKRKDYVH